MYNLSDITIIGGGIIGLLTAREFSLADASVTLIDKSLIGQESSWAGGGILLPLYPWRQPGSISQLVIQSMQLYPMLAEELLSNTGIDPEWETSGLLITNNPDLHAAQAWAANFNIPMAACNPQLLQKIATPTNNPLWLPSIAQARNPRLLKALKKDLLIRKVNFIENAELERVSITNHKITHIHTSSKQYPVNHLVLATGAWSGNLWEKHFADSAINPPMIFPVKGQMLLFDSPPGFLKHMILDHDRYLIPRRDGKILVGSTLETQGYSKELTQDAKNQLTEFAYHLLPAMKKFPLINHWAGLRPGTKNGIPYICKHPQIDNLSINAGHFRNGFAMGPASVQLFRDLILARPPALDPEPYQLSAKH